MGLPFGVGVFSVAARLTWAKAPDLVLNAFVNSLPFRAGAHLVFAGGPIDGEVGKILRRQALEHGDRRVHIIGEIEDVGTLYAASDVFVNGRRNAEPFGISIAEALASGVPVIALREGGPSEMISDGQNGWFVEAATVEGYLRAIEQAWRDRSNWEWMGQIAKTTVQELTVSQQVDKYLSIVKKTP
jgi:glycosyltransferase involved in cell wall biosynthesis